MKKVCVLGLGYIGLPTAAMFAAHGFQVLGVDINERILETVNNGQVHINEPGLQTLVRAALKSGNLHVDREPKPADVFIIAVPTPLLREHETTGTTASRWPTADLSHVIAATESIVTYLRSGNLVVLESTVPPGTTIDVLLPILERSGLRVATAGSTRDIAGREEGESLSTVVSDVSVAHCPERVLPGRILDELVRNDRVIGGVDQGSAEMAKTLYASFVEGEILLTDAITAEMVKLMENTYRDVNIALANELALVAEQVGISIWEAINLANRHPRVKILRPGPGVGGHCIAIDPWFIVQAAPKVTPLIQTARRVNDSMPGHVVELVRRVAAGIENPVIACLGLAYKADVGDPRESPAINVVGLLQAEGFEVQAYDPHLPIGVVAGQVESLQSAVDGADVVVVLTDHSEFRSLTPGALKDFAGQVVVDTRSAMPAEVWGHAGPRMQRLGDGCCKGEDEMGARRMPNDNR